jgi:hypothetical protein
MRRARWVTAVALAACAALPWRADAAQDAAAPEAGTGSALVVSADGGQPDADLGDKVWASCTEHVPSEASRPKLQESFAARALAGHAIPLRIAVEHGKGETVFPAGLQIQTASDAVRALGEAGFWIPSPDGGAGPSLTTRIVGDRALTDVVISFVALPPKPGRHVQVLPPVPITIARASGELVTVCTAPHRVTIDDPIANVPEAMPKPNPPMRQQRELWTLARDMTYGLLVGAAVAALVTWLVLWWLRRPRPAPPPTPPRPPWEIAFEELAALRGSGLMAAAQLTEFIDKGSDIVRKYLGLLYGFDGIESTTHELLKSLRQRTSVVTGFEGIASLLNWCDLVKFARVTPTTDDCNRVLQEAEQIVRSTMPQPGGAAPFAGPGVQP